MEHRWQRGSVAGADGELAMQGYDPVGYFKVGRAARGSAEHEASWSGVRWRFSSAENRDAFVAAPESYAPRCGGYCAFAVSLSENPKAPAAPPGSPQYWTIEGGRLYLNANWFANALFWFFARGRRAEEVWERLSA